MSPVRRLAFVAGARPNFMKVAPIIAEMERRGNTAPRAFLVHTGQHYDRDMSEVFFEDLQLRRPDVFLGVGSASHAEQTAKVMIAFEKLCVDERPDGVVVVGDVNSTVAAALVAVKLGIPTAHVEAGLRSFDRTMPEEINRIVTDAIADLLFTTCEEADANLLREGVASSKIHLVGNVMIDSLLRQRARARSSKILADLGLAHGSAPARPYGVLTLHRPSNVDASDRLAGILDAVGKVASRIPIVFPIHPRTMKQAEAFGLAERLRPRERGETPTEGLVVTGPLGYHDFVRLVADARLVLTDSGGIQEETTILGVSCLTLRDNTERGITVTEGTNTLVGTDPARIVAAAEAALDAPSAHGRMPRLWDGRAAARIVDVLVRELGGP